MSLRDTLRAAWQGVTANLLRSVLTTLGILIGVAAVIVLVAVGNGSAKSVSDAISALGANTLTVQAGRGGSGSFTLTEAMAKELTDKNLAPHIASVSPTVQASATAAADQKSSSIQLVGTYPSWFKAQNQPVSSGTYFDNDDVLSHAKVIVLSQTVAEDLFTSAKAAVGRKVTVGATTFTVRGVLKEQSSGPGFQAGTAVAPLPTVQAYFSGYSSLASIIVEATGPDDVDAAQAEVETVLNAVGHVTDTTNLPYSVQNASSLLETQEESGRTFTILLGVVAGISLLVGGLGITNIMLVTVTERTREIGVRKALGAPRRSILGQFLAESSLLSLTGGLLGVAVGLVVSRFDVIGITPVVIPGSVALALGICLLIGVFFGSFPAHRAAGLRPVEALRHE